MLSLFRPLLKPQGFTLLEIIVVLSLMTVIVGLSTAYYANSLPSFRLNAVTREMTSDLRKARAMAKVENRPVTLVINMDTKTYGITNGRVREIPAGVGIVVSHPSTGDQVQGTVKMTFHPHGTTEGHTIRLATLRRFQTIKLDPVIGATVTR